MSQTVDLDMITVRCIHCKTLIKFSDRKHWAKCEKHPARAAVEELLDWVAGMVPDAPSVPAASGRALLAKNGRQAT